MLGRSPLFIHRLAHFLYLRGFTKIAKVLAVLNRLILSCYIGPGAKIGKNVKFGYGGIGVVVHNDAIIHDNVLISASVTIGGTSKKVAVPEIGMNSLIGAGAKVLGPVKVGCGCVIGANAVVVNDIPDNSLVAGIPARVIRASIDIRDYRDEID